MKLRTFDKDVNAQLYTRTQLARKQLLEKYSSEDSHITTLEESRISLECKDADDRVTFLALGKINGNTFEIFHQHEEHEYGGGKYDSTVFEKIGEYSELVPPGYRRGEDGGLYRV